MVANTNLTPKQESFCRAYSIESKSQRQAYISAYGQGNKTDKSIDELASRLLKNVKVISRCKELKESLADKVIWEKADMINDLKKIAEECRDAPVKVIIKGSASIESIDSKARGVAVSAIKAASEILGYKAPDNVNLSANKNVDGIEILFVNKSKQQTAREKDPKIVGEYTPPIITE